MTRETQSLDNVLNAWEAARETIKLFRRVADRIRRGKLSPDLLRESNFASGDKANPTGVHDNTDERLDRATELLDESAIVALWTAFEETLRALLEAGFRVDETAPSHASFQELLRNEIRYARFADILDAFDAHLQPMQGIVGDAKQVKRYRDWIAHHGAGEVASKIDPRQAHKRLVALLFAFQSAPVPELRDQPEK